jgi:hypothetical protein
MAFGPIRGGYSGESWGDAWQTMVPCSIKSSTRDELVIYGRMRGLSQMWSRRRSRCPESRSKHTFLQMAEESCGTEEGCKHGSLKNRTPGLWRNLKDAEKRCLGWDVKRRVLCDVHCLLRDGSGAGERWESSRPTKWTWTESMGMDSVHEMQRLLKRLSGARRQQLMSL